MRANVSHAPPSLLKVPVGKPVDVHVTSRTDDDYGRAFAGAGMRLGGPAAPTCVNPSGSLDVAADCSSISRIAPLLSAGPAVSSTTNQPSKGGESQSTTSVQIRLPDGQKMVCHINLTQTVADLRNFINTSRPNLTRPYTISAAYPTRVLNNENATIQQEKLENSAVMVRWA
ncbi:ubiquitin-related domain-containing protein [Mycena metata]|uniref:Ubiquitin-related domain-containing protein n=1 Tax=Mycena metata TaxID=1033252 RepID=A0AAD7I0T6_9AGAR|nr:ubiquitin-related domain-containing protein [Mycena metata]